MNIVTNSVFAANFIDHISSTNKRFIICIHFVIINALLQNRCDMLTDSVFTSNKLYISHLLNLCLSTLAFKCERLVLCQVIAVDKILDLFVLPIITASHMICSFTSISDMTNARLPNSVSY